MRLRLWHRWFALSAGLLLLALGVQAWLQLQAFRSGLVDYLNQSEAVRLDRLAEGLAEEYRQAGGWDRLLRQRWRWDELLRGDGEAGVPPRRRPEAESGPRPRPPRDPERARNRPDGGPPPRRPPAAHPPPPRRPPGPAGELGFGRRLALLDAAGQRLLGREQPAAVRRQPVRVEDEVVGWLLLTPVKRADGGADRDFVHAQTWQAVWLAVALLGLALVVSWAAARHMLRPVDGLAAISRRWARGDYAARAEVRGGHELADLAHEFNQMAQTLAQARDARERWMADISHELRTPVAILRGELQALEDGIRPLDAAALASLLAETERLGRRIDELHQLAHSEGGAMHYRFGRVDLAELLRAAVEAQRGSFAEAGLRIDVQLPEAAWLERADPDRLEQLVANLLSNARHYTDRGGLVQLRLDQAQGQLLLQIDDSPPGVDPEQLSQLFERHWRGEQSSARVSGTGLGLAICRNIAQAHGGEINAAVSPLGGLRLSCRLPQRGGAS